MSDQFESFLRASMKLLIEAHIFEMENRVWIEFEHRLKALLTEGFSGIPIEIFNTATVLFLLLVTT